MPDKVAVLELDEPAPAVSDTASLVLSKYGAIWIWTVLIGLSGGLSYNSMSTLGELVQLQMFGMGQFGMRGGAPGPGGNEWYSMVSMGSTAVGLLANLASWVCLYFFFTIYVVPVALMGSAPVADDRRRRGAAMFLRRTYQFLIVSAISKITPTLFLIVYNALPKQ